MSFFKKLFGGGDKTGAEPVIKGGEIDYNGYTIRATPFKEAGQYQSCGVISKQMAGELREHRFVRADRFSSLDDTVAMIHTKGRQIIDEQGDGIFG